MIVLTHTHTHSHWLFISLPSATPSVSFGQWVHMYMTVSPCLKHVVFAKDSNKEGCSALFTKTAYK